ncbi:MurR/RpiR family transcriptional regulator [Thomasclavelia sp.]|uniref:MurR/RpiR family transcriptional regulator n=1 Tax=Thomasclavelia sp. TaxID=3025757 RepID=UPI0025DCD130|nr:MurR/RpiR family transcriptional regulator [Thomasclavelia sp.]
MKNNNYQNAIAVYDLLYLINKAYTENNDVLIAKNLLENRYDLDRYSLDKLSEKTFFSQSSLSRFIKKIGYQNYNDFKNNIIRSNWMIEKNNQTIKNREYSVIVDDIHKKISDCINNIYNLDHQHLKRIIEKLKSANTIYFMGSELSMAMTHLLQMALISIGKEAYAIFDYHYQKEILTKLEDDSLLVVISIQQRAYSHIKDFLVDNKMYKMLWTIDDDHDGLKYFDDYFVFGKEADDNLGYNELMYFILLVYNLVLN